jgi:hypothetical protein
MKSVNYLRLQPLTMSPPTTSPFKLAWCRILQECLVKYVPADTVHAHVTIYKHLSGLTFSS